MKKYGVPYDEPENLLHYYGIDDALTRQFQQTPIQLCIVRKAKQLGHDNPMYCNNVYGVNKFFEWMEKKELPVHEQMKKLLNQINELVDVRLEENMEVLMTAEKRYAKAAKKLYKLFKLLNSTS